MVVFVRLMAFVDPTRGTIAAQSSHCGSSDLVGSGPCRHYSVGSLICAIANAACPYRKTAESVLGQRNGQKGEEMCLLACC